MKIDKVELEPLRSKWYSTKIEVVAEGKLFSIEVRGAGSSPSPREYENGYLPDEGMDHVESDEVYRMALVIMEALRKENFS